MFAHEDTDSHGESAWGPTHEPFTHDLAVDCIWQTVPPDARRRDPTTDSFRRRFWPEPHCGLKRRGGGAAEDWRGHWLGVAGGAGFGGRLVVGRRLPPYHV